MRDQEGNLVSKYLGDWAFDTVCHVLFVQMWQLLYRILICSCQPQTPNDKTDFQLSNESKRKSASSLRLISGVVADVIVK